MTEQSVMSVPTWTLGDRLRKAREFAGLEQGELAARIGTSRGTISNYELGHGVKPPKPYVIRAWAEECNVSLEWLAGDLYRPEVSNQSTRECLNSTRPYGFENSLIADPRGAAGDEAADLLAVA